MHSSYYRHLRPWAMWMGCSIWLAGRGCGMAYVDRDHVCGKSLERSLQRDGGRGMAYEG